MAKHRKPKSGPAAPVERAVRERRQSPSVILAGTTAAALSTVLVFGHATDTTVDNAQLQLAAATIGIGGRGDPDAANIPHKLKGTVVPNTFSYIPVQYPAGFDIDNSVNAGVPVLDQTVKDNSNQFLAVVAYSEGTLVSEKVRRELDPADLDAPPKDGLLFVMIASPNLPNGGIYGRFPGLKIPFVLTSTGPAPGLGQFVSAPFSDPRWARISAWALGISGGKVWLVPLMAMVALRSGRSCLTTLAMARPVLSWMACATARAVNTMVRCASIDSRRWAKMGRAARSVLDIRKERSTCQSSWYLAITSPAGICAASMLVT